MSETSQTKPRLSTWVSVVLGLSLALNLLVIGLVVGTFIRFSDMEGRRPPPHSMGAAMYRELPKSDRVALRQNSQRHATHSMETRVAEAAAIAAALRMHPFDEKAVQAVLDEQAEYRIGWQKTAQIAWLDQVSQMSSADRSEYVDRLQKSLTRHHDADHRVGKRWWK
ncbi:MAG: putative membrane protein [Paracoccaceae bacterium]|jgi:uncharacterized membrane protein